MTSSGERGRPRVAGQRRRHGRAAGPTRPGGAVATSEGPLVGGVAGEEPAEVEDTEVEDTERAENTERAEATERAEDQAPVEGVEGAEPERSAPRTVALRELRAPVVALVVALVAFALVAVVGLRDHGARERDARAATAAATSALEQLLSYDYRTIDDQARANADLLTGAFRTEYATTMEKTIAPVAEKEQAVVRARASDAGVMGQTPDTVTVEVFVNQAKTAAGEDTPSVDQNRVIATLTRVGDRWLVSGLSAF